MICKYAQVRNIGSEKRRLYMREGLFSVPHLTSRAETILCPEPSNGNLKWGTLRERKRTGGGGAFFLVLSCIHSQLPRTGSLVLLAFTGSIVSIPLHDVTGGQIGADCDLPTIPFSTPTLMFCGSKTLYSQMWQSCFKEEILVTKEIRIPALTKDLLLMKCMEAVQTHMIGAFSVFLSIVWGTDLMQA